MKAYIPQQFIESSSIWFTTGTRDDKALHVLVTKTPGNIRLDKPESKKRVSLFKNPNNVRYIQKKEFWKIRSSDRRIIKKVNFFSDKKTSSF